MKRTINNRMMVRLAAQANEADLHGNYNVANHLTNVLLKYAENEKIRNEKEEDEYEYSKEELSEDIKDGLWDIATRFFDYYDSLPDARDIEDFVDSFSKDFIRGLDNIVPGEKIGKYEPETPGEQKGNDNEDIVHWEIKFVNDNDNDDDDIDEDLPGEFVLEDSEEENKKEKEEEKEEEDDDNKNK